MTVPPIIVLNYCFEAVLSRQQITLDRCASWSALFDYGRCWVLYVHLEMSYG